jgi:hypothetical protein
MLKIVFINVILIPMYNQMNRTFQKFQFGKGNLPAPGMGTENQQTILLIQQLLEPGTLGNINLDPAGAQYAKDRSINQASSQRRYPSIFIQQSGQPCLSIGKSAIQIWFTLFMQRRIKEHIPQNNEVHEQISNSSAAEPNYEVKELVLPGLANAARIPVLAQIFLFCIH